MDNNEAAGEARSLAFVRTIYEFVEMVVLAAVLTMLTFTFVGRLTVVNGPSMMNTLIDKEVLVVTDIAYTPERGDIVVFQSPYSGLEEAIVKRVIATEGETVDIDFENWIVYVDGEPLYTDEGGNPSMEPYVNYEGGRMYQYDRTFPYTIKEGEVFVMGDNRNHSNDSRATNSHEHTDGEPGMGIGTIDTRFIFGKVILRLLPISKFGTVN